MTGKVTLIESCYETQGRAFEGMGTAYFDALPEVGKRFVFYQDQPLGRALSRTGTVLGKREMSSTEVRFRTRKSMYALTDIDVEHEEGRGES